MESIRVNLAAAKYRNTGRAYLVMALAAVFAALLSIYNIGLGFRYHQEARQYEQKIKQLGQNRANPLRGIGTRSLGEEEKSKIKNDCLFLNRLITEDIFPWNRLLDELERNMPAGIILNSFHPSEDLSKTTLEGGATVMGDIAALRDNLRSSALFEYVDIIHVGFQAKDMESRMEQDSVGIEFKLELALNMNRLIPEIDGKASDPHQAENKP